jgi:hypothetical protein
MAGPELNAPNGPAGECEFSYSPELEDGVLESAAIKGI